MKFVVLHVFLLTAGLLGQSVTESAREIPLVYDVDVVVVGGTSRGVAAAKAAAENGASVFLAAPRPYLGEDMCEAYCFWLNEGETPISELARAVYAPALNKSKNVTTPMAVKYALDDALLKAKVNFLYGSYVSEILSDSKGEVAGITMVNRSGRQVVRAKVIIDATDRATAARMTKAQFSPYPKGLQTFKRIVLGGKPNPAAKKLAVTYSVEGKDYPVYEYTFELSMKDNSWKSFAKAEQIARNRSWQKGQVATSEMIYQLAPDAVKGEASFSGKWSGVENLDINSLKPAGVKHLYILGACADVSREVAGMLSRPVTGMQLGARLGKIIAQEAKERQLEPLDNLTVYGQKKKATITAEVGEMLNGIRTKKGIKSMQYLKSTEVSLPVIAKYDTVVVGGGTGGAPAGIGAARGGARTLVVEYLHGLGGVGTLGRISKYWHGNKVGFTAEVDKGVKAFSPNVKSKRGWNIEAKMEWFRSELDKAGGDVWFQSLGVGSVVKDNKFIGVVIATPFGRGVVLANTIIDATGNAVIPACAGLPTQEITGKHVSVQGTGLPSYTPGESYKNSDWTFTDDDDVLDMWRIHVVARKKYKKFFDQGQLIDTRARRRIIGDVTVSPMDIINKRMFPDTITVSKSNFDNHGFSTHELFMIKPADKKGLVGNVPYRALLPKGYDGILVTGLGMSAHGDAMPVLRMQPDVQNHGYAAGMASAMAAEEALSVRQIRVTSLQQKLAEKGIIPKSFVNARDSYPLSDARINQAIKTLVEDYTGIAIILAHPKKALPLLKSHWRETTDEKAKVKLAHVMGMMYDKTGSKTLIDEIQGSNWDKGWNFRGMGQFGATSSPLDNLIIALGRNGD
ncbi:MAG: FAD-dependent oxidoreductase [Lentisphaerales bacterium]|nr:FAD-dependent oxidoreductase [Lentisphaerales bacterium]